MNIFVFLKMVPDVVEELKISEDKKSLDEEWLRMKLNESDEHALEEAIILKEKYGGKINVVAIDAPELDDVLYSALAKGADKAVKISTDCKNCRAPVLAEIFSEYLKKINEQIDSNTLFLTGSQAIDDLEGEMVYYLADRLGIASIGVVTGLTIDQSINKMLLMREFSGGLRGEYSIHLPAVIGIQAAEKPPRYVPIAKIRMVMKTAKIEEMEIQIEKPESEINLLKFFEPETSDKAKMLDGDLESISVQIADILIKHGII
jgi:electron transfer flavoprotein beta subunit